MVWGETDDPVEVSPRLGTEYHCLLKIQLRRVYGLIWDLYGLICHHMPLRRRSRTALKKAAMRPVSTRIWRQVGEVKLERIEA
jgi:hypothetical protein